MDVSENQHIFRVVSDPLFLFVGLGIGLEVNHVTAILLQGQDFVDRSRAPVGRVVCFLPATFPALALIIACGL